MAGFFICIDMQPGDCIISCELGNELSFEHPDRKDYCTQADNYTDVRREREKSVNDEKNNGLNGEEQYDM
jgi:hypothetical protein